MDGDLSMFEIDTQTPFPAKRLVATKYDATFAKLRPGQSVKCDSKMAPRISTALRKWLEKRGRTDVVVRMVSRHDDGYGRVYMMPSKPMLMADVPARRVSNMGD